MLRIPRGARLLKASLAVGLGVAALTWLTEPAEAAPVQTFIRTIEAHPEKPPSSGPAIDITAACVRKVRDGQREAVFGYENHGPTSLLVALDPDNQSPNATDNANVIVRFMKLGQIRAVSIEELGPQVTLFKPGVHPHAFAVRYDASDKISWQVTVPEIGEELHGAWIETVSPVEKAACGRDVPGHFAVVQNVELFPPSPTNISTGGLEGEIIGYDVEAKVRSIRATCSAGGQLLEPDVVQGWPADINLEPIVPDYEVTIARPGGEYDFDMTRTTVRSVPDDTLSDPVEWLGPIADVSAVCQFGDKILVGDPFWAELDGGGFIRPKDPIDGKFFELDISQNSPVGSRLR
jgi:hypothetical protein